MRTQWSTSAVPTDVSGECRYIHAVSEHGQFRICVIPDRMDAASQAVEVISAEINRRAARAAYGSKH